MIMRVFETGCELDLDNIDCSIQVVVEVSSIMAAYFVRSAIKGPEYFNDDV